MRKQNRLRYSAMRTNRLCPADRNEVSLHFRCSLMDLIATAEILRESCRESNAGSLPRAVICVPVGGIPRAVSSLNCPSTTCHCVSIWVIPELVPETRRLVFLKYAPGGNSIPAPGSGAVAQASAFEGNLPVLSPSSILSPNSA